ncbi:MAG: Lrp/AsnC family transcriptional regulator [Planctomycetaceae bacterium]|nr:Lrp/AsnC family transcriptional regulator [Planctomycetaceae bacterium]
MKLDRIDFEILSMLQNDARISNKELAQANGISPSTCLERVRRLKNAGVIQGYHATVRAQALGIAVQAMISIRLRQHASIDFEALMREMSETREVVNCYLLSGGNDFLVHVAVRDVEHLRTLVVDRFTARHEVAHIETALIFEYVKGSVLPNYVES